MNRSKYFSLIIFILTTLLYSCVGNSSSDEQNWLAGEPYIIRQDERTDLYNWILNEADGQTNGRSRNDSLAVDRLINMANKLADYHQSTPKESYSTEIRYLVVGGKAPAHFNLSIDAELLDSLLQH